MYCKACAAWFDRGVSMCDVCVCVSNIRVSLVCNHDPYIYIFVVRQFAAQYLLVVTFHCLIIEAMQMDVNEYGCDSYTHTDIYHMQ